MSSFFTADEFFELREEIRRTASWTVSKADAHQVILDVLRAVADKLRTMEPIYYDDARTEDETELLKAYADLLGPGKERTAATCDCGELSCPCGCQAGEQPKHWIHSRTCNTQKR